MHRFQFVRSENRRARCTRPLIRASRRRNFPRSALKRFTSSVVRSRGSRRSLPFIVFLIIIKSISVCILSFFPVLPVLVSAACAGAPPRSDDDDVPFVTGVCFSLTESNQNRKRGSSSSSSSGEMRFLNSTAEKKDVEELSFLSCVSVEHSRTS